MSRDSGTSTKQLAMRGLTLAGGGISALSAGLAWARADPSSLGVAPALFVNESALLRRGFDLRVGWLSVGWVVVICGVAAAGLMLWNGADDPVKPILRAQAGLGCIVLIVALLHAGLYAGVASAAAGGAMLTAGALLSLRQGAYS